MKGHSGATNATAKRRLTFRNIVVPAIALLSLLYTVFVLRGLHNGYSEEEDVNLGRGFGVNVRIGGGSHLENKEEKKPSFPMEVSSDIIGKDDLILKVDKNITKNVSDSSSPKDRTPHSKTGIFDSKGLPKSEGDVLETPSLSNSRDDSNNKKKKSKSPKADAALKSCQIEHGSYCLWSAEHRGIMNDTLVKRMKDQLYVARAYFPTIAKLKSKEKLSQQMKLVIQEYEHIFVEAASDSELPPFISKKIEQMDQTIAKAKSCTVDCNNVDKKLRQLLDLTEDEAHFHMKQSAFLHHLGVQTKPKSHHCLSMRLTVEYFSDPSAYIDKSHALKFDDPSYQQYVIISTNVLAVSVVINSTVINSKDSGNMVFNVVTDKQYFFAMKLWFSRNAYKDAVIHIVNIEDLGLSQSQLSPCEEFRVSLDGISLMRTEYITLFGHSHFLLPDIFKNLKKVIVLDDDVVVQRDLSSLWDFDLDGKVNGAIRYCGIRLRQLKSYLGNNQIDDACAWMSGLNIIDLDKWRELNITRKYQQLTPRFDSESEASWRAAALPASLLAFQDQVTPLDDSWIISGLGYDYRISRNAVKKAGVLHYNGNMKPWLDLGIPRYKSFWRKYLTQGEPFMDQCNLNR